MNEVLKSSLWSRDNNFEPQQIQQSDNSMRQYLLRDYENGWYTESSFTTGYISDEMSVQKVGVEEGGGEVESGGGATQDQSVWCDSWRL